jgi:hypothetical protein
MNLNVEFKNITNEYSIEDNIQTLTDKIEQISMDSKIIGRLYTIDGDKVIDIADIHDDWEQFMKSILDFFIQFPDNLSRTLYLFNIEPDSKYHILKYTLRDYQIDVEIIYE